MDADGLVMLVLRGPRHRHTQAVERRGVVSGPALAAALAVVTDGAGRVLLGRSRRGMWEAPCGKIDGAEDFAAAAVRELAEETGLVARAADTEVIAPLHDAFQGVPRLTVVVRITAWSGTLTNPEPHLFTRWEWHHPDNLACIGQVFTPALHSLDAVWPGIVPSLPPVTSYPIATAEYA
ncbi:MutT-family protein [Streptomyces clavuligerus]|nr:MutT-family protein [Streptomyces clavuligerus]